MEPNVKVVQVLPKEQVKILLNALETYSTAINSANAEGHVTLDFLKFDLITLKALLQYDVKIELTNKEYQKFTQDNGVDFPIYVK